MKKLFKTKDRYLFITGLIISAFILCFMAFYNGYPLVYPDTGTYIRSGFEGFVPEDRPITYGLFIRHMSMSETLWMVIFVQGLISSLILFYYFYYLSNQSVKIKLLSFLTYIVFITFYFGASVNVSQLIPDIFTPITILSIGLLLFVQKMKRRDKIFISIILTYSISVHSSHLLIVAATLVVMFIFYVYEKISKQSIFFFNKLRNLIFISSLVLGSVLLTMSVNYFYSGKATYSRGGHVFLLARINDLGLLKDYLDNNCAKNDYKICQYKDKIPWDMLWDPQSPLYLTGGWEANKKEYQQLIKDILTTPKYLKLFIIRTLESSFKQFFTFDTGDTPPQTMGSSVFGAIDQFYHETTKEYLGSFQNNNKLKYDEINRSQKVIFGFLLILFFAFYISDIDVKWKMLISFFLLTLYFNAAVSTISCIASRFQGRVVWILPLPAFIILLNYIPVDLIKEKLNKVFEILSKNGIN